MPVGQALQREGQDDYRELVHVLGDEVRQSSALHVEISAFDDRANRNETVRKIRELTEDAS